MPGSSKGGEGSVVQQSSDGTTGLQSVSGGNNDSQEMDPEKLQIQELQKTLQDLEGLLSEGCYQSAERLIDYISNNPTDLQLKDDVFIVLMELLSDKVERMKIKEQENKQTVKQGWSLFTSLIVKVYSKVTGKTFGVDEALLEKVKSMSWSVTVETTRDLQESHVVIAFCPITTRVESDVKEAMTDITASCGQKPVILVLMHHTRDVEYSTEGRRWSDEYDNVVLDVHVLFHETKNGLLTCPKNDQAAKEILRELEKGSGSTRGPTVTSKIRTKWEIGVTKMREAKNKMTQKLSKDDSMTEETNNDPDGPEDEGSSAPSCSSISNIGSADIKKS